MGVEIPLECFSHVQTSAAEKIVTFKGTDYELVKRKAKYF